MNMQQDNKDIVDDEIDFPGTWHIIKPILKKYKYWLILTPILFCFLGLALSKLATPQWEAVGIMQIGKLSETELAEPAYDIAVRLRSMEFKDLVLANSSVPIPERDKRLYRLSLLGRQIKSPEHLEIRVRGFSSNAAAQLALMTAQNIQATHTAIIAEAKDTLTKRSGDADKNYARILAIRKKLSNSTGSDALLGELLALYLDSGVSHEKDLLHINLKAVSSTTISSITVDDAPVYPRKAVWGILAGMFGFLMVVCVALVFDPGRR